jgi:hypothetical protein
MQIVPFYLSRRVNNAVVSTYKYASPKNELLLSIIEATLESGPPAASQFTIARILGLILNLLEYVVHAAWLRWPHHTLYASKRIEAYGITLSGPRT